LSNYQKRLREKLGPELDTSYKMQRLGKIKFLLNMVVRKARTSKTVSELISASLSNEKTKKSFENPLFYLKILFC
jgi:flavin-dependent dehydrogenase